MPWYNYTCDKCGNIQLERRMTDEEIKICPYCNGELHRIFHPTQSVWKCSGAYSKSNHKE